MEVLFSPFVRQSLAELSTDLHRYVDGSEVVPLGDCGVQRGKPLPKLKATCRMEAYRVNHGVLKFTASTVDVPRKVCDIRKAESVSELLSTLRHFEQYSFILTMVGSFLDCSGATSTGLLDEEVSRDEGARVRVPQRAPDNSSGHTSIWSVPEGLLWTPCCWPSAQR